MTINPNLLRDASATLTHKVFYSTRQALRRHATAGNVLLFATGLALIVANIPGIKEYYNEFWTQEVRLQVGGFNLFSHHGQPMNMLAFINDALMAVFFFTIGLEIKREVLVGELSSFRQAFLPIMGAIGGMIARCLSISFLHMALHMKGARQSRWLPTSLFRWVCSPCSESGCRCRLRYS